MLCLRLLDSSTVRIANIRGHLIFQFHFKIAPNSIFWLLLLALVTYWIGVFGVTVFGNIPLNEILDKINLESITLEEIKTLRISIEVKWNNLNLIRSISSGITFLLLIVSSLFLNK